METLNCPKCQQTRKFSVKDKNGYECETCHTTYKMCKNKNCSNLVEKVSICNKCIDKGLKKGGSLALFGIMAIGGIIVKRIIR